MTTLEIVHVRCARDLEGAFGESLAAAVAAESAGEYERVAVYRRSGVPSDLAIHIRRRGPSSACRPGRLAARLATALRELGMVEHSVWTEMGQDEEADDAT
jgi:hypothetical protein